MTTTVVHCKREGYTVYIGRPRKGHDSIWGNIFHLIPSATDRDRVECLIKYARWLAGRPELMARVHELRGEVLGCWCAPRRCHGDVLARLADAGEPREELARVIEELEQAITVMGE